MRRRYFWLYLFLLTGMPGRDLCPADAAPRMEWRAGAATVDITPAGPIWMAGYAARKHPSEGVAQHLYAKALALEDRRGARFVIITSDLLGFPKALSDAIAEKLRRRHKP